MTSDAKSETPVETPKIAPTGMTFKHLREGLGKDCDCLSDDECKEDTERTYAHRVQKMKPDDQDFLSYREEKGDGFWKECEKICESRGVSINRLTAENEQVIIEEWKAEISHKKKKIKSRIYCKFKMKCGGGKIKPTPRGDVEPGKSHCTLYKCDDFDFKTVEIIDVFSLE